LTGQQVFVLWSQTPPGQLPQVIVLPQPSLNVPHAYCA
jgi:hypothetical protein